MGVSLELRNTTTMEFSTCSEDDRKMNTGKCISSNPLVITGKEQMRAWSRFQRSTGRTIALVPTMGCLHSGHLFLIQEAQKLASATVVSIYVNPAQFSPTEDFSSYPSDFEGDLIKLRNIGVHAVLHPHNLYDYSGHSRGETGCRETLDIDGKGDVSMLSCIERESGQSVHQTWIRVEKLEKGLCGKSRPVFFRGVATVVAKLFNIVEPDIAIFGKKDYQQWRIIEKMACDLDFGIKIIGLETVRDADGLAVSSRNVYLTPEERRKALSIFGSLSEARIAAENGQISVNHLKNLVLQAIAEAGGKVDYVEIVTQENLEVVDEIRFPVVFCVAAWFGKTRLVDNVEINILDSHMFQVKS